MKLSSLLEGINTKEVNVGFDMDISGVSYDSRNTKPGDAFVAIKGFESDGHDYIDAAVEKGACLVVCENTPSCEIPYVLVNDSRFALAIMSQNLFENPASGMKLIGVTGTNGKTTTTMLIKHVLEKSLEAKVGLMGTNQNMIGSVCLHAERTTPESYEIQKLLRDMADAGCEYVVMEVSSHALALSRVAGLQFEVGIFTNLTQDHLDFHKNMDDYARAKSDLFKCCKKAAVNIDDGYGREMINEFPYKTINFAIDNNTDVMAENIKLFADRVNFLLRHEGQMVEVNLGIPGRFSVYNAMAVISCALLLDISINSAVCTLENAEGVKGRMEAVNTDGDYTILIDYAHTPDALENVLKSLFSVTEGRVVALFGCGGDRDKTKRPEMGRIASKYADFVIVTSDNPRTENPSDIIEDIIYGLKDTKTPYIIIEDRRKAIAYAIDNHMPKDVIVLAGKGHETYQIIGKTKHHMDEREIVSEHLELRRKKISL